MVDPAVLVVGRIATLVIDAAKLVIGLVTAQNLQIGGRETAVAIAVGTEDVAVMTIEAIMAVGAEMTSTVVDPLKLASLALAIT